MSEFSTTQQETAAPRWQPISAIDRRVAGVLVEKAKTIPSAYPMSINAIVTACNQKSNRSPVMTVEPDDLEQSLERLRKLGAVGMVEGYGRVTKYRHYLYDWLGVDKVEIAVMAELLLRGAQTVGELRARAARMEPIKDMSALQPVLAGLKSKGLVIPLTPEGRGHVVSHALHPPDELDRIKQQYSAGVSSAVADISAAGSIPSPSAAAPAEVPDAWKRELEELRGQMAELRSDLNELTAAFRESDEEVSRLKQELGD